MKRNVMQLHITLHTIAYVYLTFRGPLCCWSYNLLHN